MMQSAEGVPYASARDFERALVDRIATAAESSPYGVAEIRRQFAYGRLLARVFTHAPDEWVVKGAAGLLARIPGRARHSIDVDLYFAGELDAGLPDVYDRTVYSEKCSRVFQHIFESYQGAGKSIYDEAA